MFYTDYLKQVAQMQEQYHSLDLLNIHTETARLFTFFSANLHAFLPKIPWESHQGLFKEMAINQNCSVLDMQCPELLDNRSVEAWQEGWIDTLQQTPGIIATFHTGSYRLLNLLLAKAGVRFTLLLSRKLLKREGELFRNAFRTHSIHQGTGHFELIDAEEPSALLKMFRAIKKGHCLVLYPDGNLGANNTVADKHMEVVHLLNGALRVKKGAAFLAHALQVPMYPVIAERKDVADLIWHTYDPIIPQKQQDQVTFLTHATQYLYSALENLLKHTPAQWTCWPNLHRLFIPQESRNEAGSLCINSGQWGFFQVDRVHYLFDKVTYKAYPITMNQYRSYLEALIPNG